MSRDISQAFDTLHSWLTPTLTETSAAKSHRASIEQCLKNNFGITRFFRSGSFGNGTSIQGFSDVDYIASIPPNNLKKDSNISLREINRVLDNRFPHTGVEISSPAITVPFGGENVAETTEIVPAYFIKKDVNNHHHYGIPDSNGNWMLSSPDAHKYYVDYYDKKTNGKLKKLIRFVKAWKYYNAVPISSFFLEMYVSNYASIQETIYYPVDLKIIFSRLSSNLSYLQDPMGISGLIAPCKNTYAQAVTIEELKVGAEFSKKAFDAQLSVRMGDAFKYWGKFYNEEFPLYY